MGILNELALRMWATVQALAARLHDDERGQDTAEYIIMTAVVVAIIVGVVYAAYQGALQGAVTSLASAISGAP